MTQRTLCLTVSTSGNCNLKRYAHQNDYENSINLQWLSGLSSVFSRVAHRSRPWCTDVTCNTEATTAL